MIVTYRHQASTVNPGDWVGFFFWSATFPSPGSRCSTTKILKPLNYRYFFIAFKSPLVLLKLFLKNRLQPKRPTPRLLHHCPEYYTCTVKINFSCITVPVAVVSITISLYLCVCAGWTTVPPASVTGSWWMWATSAPSVFQYSASKQPRKNLIPPISSQRLP